VNFSATSSMMLIAAMPTTSLPLDPMIGFAILLGVTFASGLVILGAGLAARPPKVVARRMRTSNQGEGELRWLRESRRRPLLDTN
jgi:hypothetical protein